MSSSIFRVPTVEKRVSAAFWTTLHCQRCDRVTKFSVRGDGVGRALAIAWSADDTATDHAHAAAEVDAQRAAMFVPCHHCGAPDPRGVAYRRRTHVFAGLAALLGMSIVLASLPAALTLAVTFAAIVHAKRNRPRARLAERVEILDGEASDHLGVFR